MKLGFLGNGKVARTLGWAFQQSGHELCFGARDPSAPRTRTEHPAVDAGARVSTLGEAAAFGDIVVLAINPWTEIEAVLRQLPRRVLDGKVLLDLSNDIDFSGRPALSSTERSLGQRIQGWVPGCRVVKTLNFIPADLMVSPAAQGIALPIMWVAGDDPEAKNLVSALLRDLGWREIVDMGGIEASRFQEAIGLLISRVVTDLLRVGG